ncbi:Uncharacterised protein [Vibrio cholerae]|nr:Uncharacterised protein [Vibrio cholerae]
MPNTTFTAMIGVLINRGNKLLALKGSACIAKVASNSLLLR